MIQIDFQGGAHGNYLEFVCNKLCGVTADQLPFSDQGAAHAKKYTQKKIFHSNHYSYLGLPLADRLISIQITVDDLLPLTQISLLRAGNYGYDSNELEIDTYNKLNNPNYRWVLDQLISGFFKNQIQKSYNNIKDPSWPSVSTIVEFDQLPDHIKNECIDMHHLELLELSKDRPNCPRSVLLEFFQIGFENPNNQGFMQRQQLIDYGFRQVHVFPFECFYNIDKFVDQIKNIASWANISYTNYDSIIELHCEFLKRQPYKDSKLRCDNIVQSIIDNCQIETARDLLEEAYINAQLRKKDYERRY
jgi:hypothetical protein